MIRTSLEQIDVESMLKRLDVQADGWLNHAEGGSRAAEAVGVGHRDEGAKPAYRFLPGLTAVPAAEVSRP